MACAISGDLETEQFVFGNVSGVFFAFIPRV
jgi:hypothetical protein